MLVRLVVVLFSIQWVMMALTALMKVEFSSSQPSGILVQWDGLYQYSDAPLNLTSKPLITFDANAKPTSTAGQTNK